MKRFLGKHNLIHLKQGEHKVRPYGFGTMVFVGEGLVPSLPFPHDLPKETP